MEVSLDRGSFCSQFYPINSVLKEFSFFQSQNLLKRLTKLLSCVVRLYIIYLFGSFMIDTDSRETEALETKRDREVVGGIVWQIEGL